MNAPDPPHRTSATSAASVEVVVTGDRIDPAVFVRIVGQPASRGWKHGEPYTKKTIALTRPTGLWALQCRATEVEPAARALLALVEAHGVAIRDEATKVGGAVAVAIWWEPAGGQGGFSLPTEVARRLSLLGDRLDVYFPG